MLRYANQQRIYTSTSTNAHYLNEVNAKETVISGLDQIIISIDGTDQQTYEKYRIGGQLAEVIDGTRRLIKWKKRLRKNSPYVILQFLLFKFNEHQVADMKSLGNEIGADEVRFKTAQIYDYQSKSAIIPENTSYTRYIKDAAGHFKLSGRQFNHCWRMWSSCVITWDSRVVPCCFDKDANYKMGIIGNGNFRELWKGVSYSQFRKKILKDRKSIDICSNCSEGTRIWA
jgi:radical SAM protein with 4Fe4S-binding SPASM domain